MLRLFVLTATATLFLSPALLRAEDTYTIKIRDAAEGDVQQVKKTETSEGGTKITDATGKAVVDQKGNSVTTSVYKETVLKCEPKKNPTKLERIYEKATSITNGTETTFLYQGKTVLIEKKDDGFHFSIDGEELSGKAATGARPLFTEFAKDKEIREELERLLPKKPVKVNDSWDIDLKPFLTEIAKDGMTEIDTDKAKGSGTLVKAYKKDGKQFGVLKITVTMPIKSMGKGDQKIVVDAKSAMTMDIDMDFCIDGSASEGTAKSSMKMEVKGMAKDPQGGKLDLDISVRTTAEEVSKEAAKK